MGQPYPTDSGPWGILAVSKDTQRLLVIALKRDRASDTVVGGVLPQLEKENALFKLILSNDRHHILKVLVGFAEEAE